MAARLAKIPGVSITTPRGAFYLLVDFNAQHEQFLRLGLSDCDEFCEDMLAVEHIAMLPASSLLLPDNDFSVRCSYVDYDGEVVLAEWRTRAPADEAQEESFVRRHCPLVADGVEYIERYIVQVREGTRPKHA
jgi:aspartate/methionine/tyrosine aminotransferase